MVAAGGAGAAAGFGAGLGAGPFGTVVVGRENVDPSTSAGFVVDVVVDRAGSSDGAGVDLRAVVGAREHTGNGGDQGQRRRRAEPDDETSTVDEFLGPLEELASHETVTVAGCCPEPP